MSEEPKKMDRDSMDISKDKRDQIKKIFPEVFKEDKIDFDQFKRVLGEWVEPNQERFGLDWPGKSECMKVIQAPAKGTLKPCKEKSLDWDSTENLFIEGDNLEVLKLLQKSYFSKVKMIYIDPPYNTGKEFIYPDKYTEGLDTYLRYTGQKGTNGEIFSTNSDANGRFHSRWLNMMYPRIFLARNLLREDGIFVAHIDEHEATNFHMLLGEIFGSENCLGTMVWDKKNPKGDAKAISVQHETILVYAKDLQRFLDFSALKRPKKNAKRMLAKAGELFSKKGKDFLPSDIAKVIKKYSLPVNQDDFKKRHSLESINDEYQKWLIDESIPSGESPYKYIDSKGNVYREVSMSWPNKKDAPEEYRKPLIHPRTKKECPVPERGWRYPPKTMEKLLHNGEIVFGQDECTQPRRKYFLKDNMYENISSIFPFGGSDDKMFKKLDIRFDNPKPVKLSLELLRYFAGQEDCIVLDFFAGSATVAHASMLYAREINHRIRYICVQLPEPTSQSSDETISSLAIRRIKESSNLVKHDDGNEGGFDSGFRVFRLSKSCFKEWDGRIALSQKGLFDQIQEQVNYIDVDASTDDILYEIILKNGLKPMVPIETFSVQGKRIYSIESGALIICLDRNLTEEFLLELSNRDPAPAKVVCLDAGFNNNDELKVNAVHIFKTKSHHKETNIEFFTI